MGEGFGLPIVEGAQKGIPMIIRNIPVLMRLPELTPQTLMALREGIWR
jgi:hypothetical protein